MLHFMSPQDSHALGAEQMCTTRARLLSIIVVAAALATHPCAGIYDRRRYRGVAVGTDANGAPLRTHRQRGGHTGHGESGGSSSDNTEFEDTYVVECACGTQVDDGHLMIECESCKAWAHTACLQAQMVSCWALCLVLEKAKERGSGVESYAYKDMSAGADGEGSRARLCGCDF
jgi:hypothetical protein